MTNQPCPEKSEPEITAFYCVYCGYMSADSAGMTHIQYPANVKFVRLPCTGKTDIRYILEAFEQGADGVYQIACPIGNYHHVRGNERGLARVQRAIENPGCDRSWSRPVGNVFSVRWTGTDLCYGSPCHD